MRGRATRVRARARFRRVDAAAALRMRPTLVVDETGLASDRRQALVGVIVAQHDAVFRARRQHAVGFVDAFGDEIVDEHADVRFAAREPDRRSPRGARRVDSGDEPLRGSLFVSGGSVELAAMVEAGDAMRLQRVAQLRRGNHVVLDGVAGAHHRARLQTRQRMQHLELHFGRKRRRKSADVERRLVPSFGFDEDLVRRIVRELHDLVFDRRAIARPDAADEVETVERRSVKILTNERVRARVGLRDETGQLRTGKSRFAAIREE